MTNKIDNHSQVWLTELTELKSDLRSVFPTDIDIENHELFKSLAEEARSLLDPCIEWIKSDIQETTNMITFIAQISSNLSKIIKLITSTKTKSRFKESSVAMETYMSNLNIKSHTNS